MPIKYALSQPLESIKKILFKKGTRHECEKARKEEKNREIQRFLYFAKTYSPWYKKQLSNVRIDKITEDNLLDLPRMSKQLLMDNWDEIVTVPSLNLARVKSHLDKMRHTEELQVLDDKYLLLSTGGSSGKKGIFLVDYHQFKEYIIYRAQTLKKSVEPFVDFKGHEKLRIAQVIVTNGVYGMYVASKIFTAEHEEPYYFPISLPMPKLVEGLNRVQPHIITAIPSTMHLLCLEALKGHLVISPRIIRVAAEPLYSEIRQMVYKLWPNARLYNIYAASEGFAATSCRPNCLTMHLPNTYHTFIPVDKQGNRIEDDEYSDKLIVTFSRSSILPLINYELEDSVRFIDKPCSCGRSEPLIEEPLGRKPHFFTYKKNITVHPLIFTTPLLAEGNIVEFQVYQTHGGAKINVVVSGTIQEQKLIMTIKNSFTQLGLPNAFIAIDYVDKIPRQQPSGKLNRFIPLGR